MAMRSVDIARMAIGAGVFALVSGATLAASKVEQDAPMATPLGITVQSVGKAYYTPGNALLSSIGQKAYNYADAAGMTLYTYEKDQNTPGKSACIGECATLWLPLIAPANIKPDALWSTITRDDGSKSCRQHRISNERRRCLRDW